MLEKLTQEEEEIIEGLYNPVCLTESLFGNLDNMIRFEEDEFSHIRLSQYCLFSHEYLIDTDNKELSDKENFKLREGAGTCYVFGGRKFGKSLCVEICDLLISMMLVDGENCGFTSYDAMHIRGILEKVIQVLENHPFFDMFNAKINRSPSYRLFLRNGYCCEGVNMNLAGTDSGSNFFQKHFSRLYQEEASIETQKVYEKRIDAVSENGCIYRAAGMTNFTKWSPPGKIFYDLEKRPQLVNFPQYINPKYDNKMKEKAIKEYGGESSIGFRIFVKGEVVEDGISALDMERIRKNYDEKRQIKHFEINKENYSNYEYSLVLERPSNANMVYVAEDVGENVSEIIVIFQINDKYKYAYNITLYNLTDKEQFKVLKYIAGLLSANIIALDCSDGQGRAIYRSLEDVFPKENLCWVGFQEKIKVDLEKDDKGNTIMDDHGQPVWKEEYVDAWSIKRIRDLLYEEGKFNIPLDYKLDTQLNSVISTQSGNRTLYTATSAEDHLLAAWRVFSIAEWINYLTIIKPIKKKKFAKIGC